MTDADNGAKPVGHSEPRKVLLDVTLIDEGATPAVALQLEGRKRKQEDKELYVLSIEGAAVLVGEIAMLAARAPAPVAAEFDRIFQRQMTAAVLATGLAELRDADQQPAPDPPPEDPE